MPPPKKTQAPSSPTFMDPALMPWALVSELYWMSYKLQERRLYELGVSASQARVIMVLHYAAAPIKPSLVATILFQETQSITGIIHRIEERGWVVRLPDANDRRAIGLELTDAGHKIADQIARISEALFNDLFEAALTSTERRQVEAGLRKIRSVGFRLPETDFKLRRAQLYPIWKD